MNYSEELKSPKLNPRICYYEVKLKKKKKKLELLLFCRDVVGKTEHSPIAIVHSLFSKYWFIIVGRGKFMYRKGVLCFWTLTRTDQESQMWLWAVSQVTQSAFLCMLNVVFNYINTCIEVLKTRSSVGQHLFIMMYSLNVWTTKIISVHSVNHIPISSLVFTFSWYKQSPIDFEQILLE